MSHTKVVCVTQCCVTQCVTEFTEGGEPNIVRNLCCRPKLTHNMWFTYDCTRLAHIFCVTKVMHKECAHNVCHRLCTSMCDTLVHTRLHKEDAQRRCTQSVCLSVSHRKYAHKVCVAQKTRTNSALIYLNLKNCHRLVYISYT